MDSREAKEILMRHRPGRGADADPELATALAQAERDPELARWLEQHRAFQIVIRERLRELTVPPGLKQRILDAYPPAETVVAWGQPLLYALAAAAAIVLLVGLLFLQSRSSEDRSFAAYRNRVVRNAQRGYLMDVTTTNLGEIRLYLKAHNAHADYNLPARLEKMPGDGGAVLHWNNKTVSMVCFDLGNKKDLYLFVASRADLPDAPAGVEPEFARVGKLTTASWSAGDKAYVLAGPGDEQFLRRYLEP
jgi:hypothetical protein